MLFRLEIMKVAGLICDETIAKDVLAYFPDDYANRSIISTIYKMAPSFSDTIAYCKLFDRSWEKCHNLLYPIVVDEGLCYKFNGFNKKDMFTDQ